MLMTNIHGLPNTITDAILKKNSDYNKGDVDRSVTQLINSPRIDLLRKNKFSEIELDASQDFWPLLGTAVHKILEMGKQDNQVLEERLYAELDGWKLSGALDVQEYNSGKITIYDYKVCTLFALRQNDGFGKSEWIAQQNIYRWLVEKNKGIPVEALYIVAIIRDWQNSGTLRDTMYPPSPIQKIPVEMWSMDETEKYIHDRINTHRQADMVNGFDGELPDCTPEERWERPTKFRVKKKGGKRASRVFASQFDADAFMASSPDTYEVEIEEGENVRCEGNYCQVAAFCSQFARMKK